MVTVLNRFGVYAATVLLVFGFSAANAETLTIGGTGSALGTMRALGKVFTQEHPGVRVAVLKSLGSGGGIRALAAGKLDIAVSARPLKTKETAKIPGVRSIHIGTTALAVVTRRKDVDALTTPQLAKIIDGTAPERLNATPILFILRPKKETDTMLLAGYSPLLKAALKKARASPSQLMAFTDQDNMDLAEKVKGAITLSTMSGVISEGRALRALSLDGIAPTLDNIGNGTYPLTIGGYFILSPKTSSTAEEFVKFAVSAKGQNILRANGYLPRKVN